MEFLLLWADELDDAIAAARHLTPRILGVLAAIGSLAAAAFALMPAPRLLLGALALALAATVMQLVRRRRTPFGPHRGAS
ncbi:MAG TPA: hypothetical protein VHK24_15340 [Steroidobacter sp.]|nr:hypothetical protein [Steroidobacter sp.]